MSALIEITTDAPEFLEREPLFSIDGVTYTIPKVISGSTALTMLKVAREEGEGLALAWVMEEVLGTEAFNALSACKTVTQAQIGAIMTVVRERAMAAMEAVQGE